MSYKVEYWTRFSGQKKKYHQDICFARLPRAEKAHDYIIYKCPINDILSVKDVQTYLKFLKKILPQPFKYYITKKSIFYKLKTTGLSREIVLLILTAFRYPDEYPDIALATAQLKGKLEKKFENFQHLHFNYIKGTLKNTSGRPNNMGGHGLIYEYAWNNANKQSIEPISLDTFKNNFKRNLGSVHKYFLTRS